MTYGRLYGFWTRKMFVRRKFTSTWLQWTMEMWRNGVGCSKKARLMYITRNEVGARTVQVGKFRASSIQSRLSPNDYHLFFGLKIFLAVQSQRSDQETKDVVQDWLQGLAATFLFEDMQKLKMSLLHGLSCFVYWVRGSFRNAVSFVFFIWLFK